MGIDCSIDIDDCARQPCLNGANCVDLLDDFKVRKICDQNYDFQY